MSLNVGDLHVTAALQGNLISDLGIVRTRLQQLGAQTGTAEQNITQMGRAASQASNSLRRIDVDSINAITRNADNAGESLRRLDRWQLDALIREANRAGQSIGQELPAGASHAERAIRRLDNQGLERLIRDAQQARREIGQIGDDAPTEEQGQESGGGFLAGFAGAVKGLGTKAGPIGLAIFGAVALGVGAGAILMKNIQDGMDLEADQDKIQAQLGIDDATMARIGRAAGAAYSNNFGETLQSNLEAARDAVQSGLLNPDADQATIQKMIEGLSTVVDITEEEMPDAVRAVTQLMQTGLAKNAEEAFDIIVKGQQAGLNASKDWLDSIDEYSTQFRKFGLSAADGMGLLSQAVKGGARDTDVAADALKEFSIRSIDGSKAAKEGYEALGLSAEEMITKFAAGGPAARESLGLVLDRLRAIEDPAERSAAAVGLFGTQAEDLGDALFKMNLGTAAKELGNVAGVAAQAASTLGDNGAAKLEAARRSIEVSMLGVKTSIAEAFGPGLTKVADWINTHKPEITAFFIGMADRSIATGQAIASFVSGVLRGLALFAEGSSRFFGGFLTELGFVSSGVGGILKHIPGMRSVGEGLQSAGNAMQSYQGKMSNLSTDLTGWADGLDRANGGLQKTREQLAASGADMVAAQTVTRALGDTVRAIPEGKGIKITDNSPEVTSRLQALGLQVTTMPDGTVKVTAHTAEAQALLDGFIRVNNNRTITMQAQIDYKNAQAEYNRRGFQGPIAPSQVPGLLPKAEGGVEEAGGAKIANSTIYQWAEAGPEAFIPLSPERRQQSKEILSEVAKRFGMNLVPLAAGGIMNLDALKERTKGIEGAKYVFGGWGDSWNTDCTGAQARIANMIAYGDPMKGGRFATGNAGSALASRGYKQGQAPPGVAAHEVGWIHDPDGPGGGHASGTFWDAQGNGVNIEMGGSRGNGQFDGQAMTARAFANIMHIPLTTSAGTGTGTQTQGPGALAGSPGNSSSPIQSSAIISGSVQKVFVVGGRLDGSTTPGGSDTSAAPPGLRPVGGGPARQVTPLLMNSPGTGPARNAVPGFAGGGTVPGSGKGDIIPALLEPGEEVIRKDPAARFRSLLKSINTYQSGGTAGTGFGGGYDPNPDPARKLSLYDIAAIGVGLGFTAVSGFDSTGKFTGFDTSNTTAGGLGPQLEQALNELAKKIQPVPAVVVEHAEVTADRPEQLLDGLIRQNPAFGQITSRGLL